MSGLATATYMSCTSEGHVHFLYVLGPRTCVGMSGAHTPVAVYVAQSRDEGVCVYVCVCDDEVCEVCVETKS